ncbi:VWA domain-containing protein [Sporosarcina oncorhynchi]|uniref:VWA domain-containing protein n=1 Tax=Sporosarcina oncorhynchi TaxID=3056444 RepID=A0ABZ0L9T4_9BACL|nr:VWA domain-containing protein [Sporosarcina sp. T2O-4]WOV88249.1 VWA domain-containing protein [Sporosarcina sp. T2O-4]
MNKNKYSAFIFMLLLLLIVTACSDNKNNKNEEVNTDGTAISDPTDNNKEDENSLDDEEAVDDSKEDVADEITAAPLPQSLAELEELPAGYTEYISILDEEGQKKIDELTAHLPDISGEPSQNQLDHYYNGLLAVFQQDFNGPDELIAKLKFQSIGSPDIDNPRMQFKENMNVLVILDGSGSMGQNIGGQTQMEAAKKAIVQFVENLPKEANVGLRVYGHKGTGSKADKAMSCSSSDLLYELKPYEKGTFKEALDQVKPAGWTPTELAITEAQKDLANFDGENNTNIVYLVSDGISTCDDDPVTAAKALYDSDITPIINVIGFNVDNDGQRQLKEVAKAVEGTYQDVQDATSLQKELDQATEIANQWASWKEKEASSLEHQKLQKGLDIFGYDTDEFKKNVDERQQVGFTLQYLYQTKKIMSQESHDYLRTKNTDYHDWIQSQLDALKADLKNMNEMQFTEAIEALEEKYLKNTPD